MTDQVERLSDSWDAHAHEWIKWVRAPDRQDSYWRFHRERFLSLIPAAGRLTVDIGCGEGRVGILPASSAISERRASIISICGLSGLIFAAIALFLNFH